MPFPFPEICVLLSRLEDIELRDPPFLNAADKSAQIKGVTESWFKSHRRAINELNINDAVALLSALLPERRTDRVYNIQAERLCRILSRCLSLSAARTKDLHAYKQPSFGDLGACVERVLSSGGPPGHPSVKLNEVDEILELQAGRSRFSEPGRSRLPPRSCEARDNVVGNIFKRLNPTEGKWLVRIMLKDLSPVRVNEVLVLKSFHFLLPDLLRFQDNFDAVVSLLKGPLQSYPENPDPRSQDLFRQQASELLKPVVGVKVGRPAFNKARSIDRCMKMLGGEQWVLERKYDGEYCEVHVDLSRSPQASECIVIFSKSGKNSTADRKGLHQTLVECLRLGQPDSRIKREAILFGEMVAYSDTEQHILPFEHIRKHITRSGVSLGTDEDSQPQPHEHLAIVFFDLLVLDDELVMRRPINERRQWLREVYKKIGGRAMGAEWKVVDFKRGQCAKRALVQQFAASIAERCEGLVLKPCNVPYFALERDPMQSYIKLKKDYMADLGDEADFAVVGTSYDAQQALRSGLTNIKWTDFHLACLVNKADTLRFDARPRFKIVGTIQRDACIPKPVLQAANAVGKFGAKSYDRARQPAHFDLECDRTLKVDVVFDNPFVFEVLGSGFEKPSNASFFMLRHARVKKLQEDRTWKDCVSMQELQAQAAASRAAPFDSESQETRRWIQKLEAKCKKKYERQRTATPRSGTTATPTTADSARSRVSDRVVRGVHISNPAEKPKAPTVPASSTAMNTTSIFEGTNLVAAGSSVAKRPRGQDGESPCPNAKRSRTGMLTDVPSKVQKVALEKRANGSKGAPLSDITNAAPRPSSGNNEAPGTRRKDKSHGILKRLSTLFRPRQATSTSQKIPSSNRSDLLEKQERPFCGSTCLFANTVIYLTSCIARTPYIVEDLLSSHNVTTIPTLAYWDRDSFAHPPLIESVSESPAHEGMRKIVLVEAKRTRAVKAVAQEVLALNRGKWRERIEMYDWRILEECTNHDFGAGRAKRHFLGATMFDGAGERTMFAANCDWL